MRILLLSDNFPPETNAGALRTEAHARRWVEQGHEVTVLTSFPNFPEGRIFAGYRQKLWQRTTNDGVTIIRVPTLIFPNSGIVKRICDFVSYMLSATIAAIFLPRPDIVVATSPQFFAALAGWFVSVIKWRPFVFELRDFWPDSIVAVGALKDGPLLGAIRSVEHFLYRKARLIVAVTKAFKMELISRAIPAEKITVVRNGADLARFFPGHADPLRQQLGLEKRIVVSYIGTIGMAHGLDILLEVAADLARRCPQVTLLIVGSGAERDTLRQSALDRGLSNMMFVGRVSHDEIAEYWRLSDMALILLKDTPLFRTVIPSKMFEAMATGTPIITNVRGESEELLNEAGAAVHVEPGKAGELTRAIEELAGSSVKRAVLSSAGVVASAQYQRSAQADLMLTALVEVVGNGAGNPANGSTAADG